MPTFQALRSALRGLRRAPRLSLAIIVCVALGVAAAGAVFALVGPTLLRPLPFPDADRLVRVWLSEPGSRQRTDLSYPDVADLGAVTTFDRFEASGRARLVFQWPDGGRRTEGEAVTPGYARLLGARTVLGRWPDADEHRRGERVMVLSHGAWSGRFGGRPDIVGATVSTNAGEWTVVGVAAAEFGGTVEEDSGEIEFWVPLDAYWPAALRERRDGGNIWSVARLAPGVSLATAAPALAAVSDRVATTHPVERSDLVYRIEPFGENWRAPLRSGGALLLIAAGMLLLVAAVNVAGLLLARAIERRRELAVRIALGASRRRAAAALIGEALVLVGIGGAIGIGIGPAVLDLFLTLAPSTVPEYVSRTPGWTYTALSLFAVLVVGLVASGGPAMLATRSDPMAIIRAGGRGAVGGRSERRWGSALVIAEVALTIVLAVSAGLLARSFGALAGSDLGFRTERMLRIGFFPDPLDAPDADAIRTLSRRARDELAALPGVQRVARVSPTVPLWYSPDVRVELEGVDSRAGGIPAAWYPIDEHFFDTADIPVLAGRAFRSADGTDGPRIALVSASLAERFGDPERAIGRTLTRDGVPPFTIVGVTGNARFTGPRPDGADGTQVYTLMDQIPSRLVSFLIATDGDPGAVVADARRVLATVAPRSALDWVESIDEALALMFARERFLAALIGAFSTAALVLAAVGLFAVLANLVARSRAELGVRQVLGAAPARIAAEFVGRGLRLVAFGLAVGLPITVAAAWILRASLFGIGVFDPVAWLGAAAVLLGVGGIAAWVPARRAARTSPMEALR